MSYNCVLGVEVTTKPTSIAAEDAYNKLYVASKSLLLLNSAQSEYTGAPSHVHYDANARRIGKAEALKYSMETAAEKANPYYSTVGYTGGVAAPAVPTAA